MKGLASLNMWVFSYYISCWLNYWEWVPQSFRQLRKAIVPTFVLNWEWKWKLENQNCMGCLPVNVALWAVNVSLWAVNVALWAVNVCTVSSECWLLGWKYLIFNLKNNAITGKGPMQWFKNWHWVRETKHCQTILHTLTFHDVIEREQSGIAILKFPEQLQ